MDRFTFTGDRLREARFPMGGIGTGSVSLDGGARFVDFEIANRPNKLSRNGMTHLAIRAESSGEILDLRALHGPLLPPYMGDEKTNTHNGFVFGPGRETLAGLPHFGELSLTGRFPIAEYSFGDGKGKPFPGKVKLTAMSPLEPHNPDDSSLPLAMLTVSVDNPTDQTIDYTVAFTLQNPHPQSVNIDERHDGCRMLRCGTSAIPSDQPSWGELAVATDAAETSLQTHWYRGGWYDALSMYWRDMKTPGPIAPRSYEPSASPDHGTLCARVSCPAGGSVSVRFAMAWYYPTCQNDGSPRAGTWKNWYATKFSGVHEIAAYALRTWDRLETVTRSFVDTAFSSTLPPEVIDAAVSTLSVLKSPTCLRLEDGSFYGFEGCHCGRGCCEGSCTHVWNYQYALPFLFPTLERSMRELDYTYNLKPDGGMPFRLQLPLGSPPSAFRPCVDGQMGGIVKMYREWKNSGDTAWMLRWWPKVRSSLEFAWSDANPDRWDPERLGVMTGRQHHTLDMELFGPNAWLTGMYQAALDAASRMADAAGDASFAAQCRDILARGKAWVKEHLFNGEYFIQKVDLYDRDVLKPYDRDGADTGLYETYWNAEAGELKYQTGEGSSIDQLLGQWHADLCGLGRVFDSEQSRKALASLAAYNFMPRVGDVYNPCRLYCLEEEAGLAICAYPQGRERPVISAPYAEETMHGFEYAAACAMIHNGMQQEGLRAVRAVRDRYDGSARNPWNEIECGSNYARSMAAWSLINAYQGLSYDLTEARIGFAPIVNGDFCSIWSVGGAWGALEITENRAALRVLGGSITLRRVDLPFHPQSVRLYSMGELKTELALTDGEFTSAATLSPGDELRFLP